MNPFDPFYGSTQPTKTSFPKPGGGKLFRDAADGAPRRQAQPSQDLLGMMTFDGLFGAGAKAAEGDVNGSAGASSKSSGSSPSLSAASASIIDESHLLRQLTKLQPSSTLSKKKAANEVSLGSFELASSTAFSAAPSSLEPDPLRVSPSPSSSTSTSSTMRGAQPQTLLLRGAPAPQTENSSIGDMNTHDEGERIDSMIRPLLNGMAGGGRSDGIQGDGSVLSSAQKHPSRSTGQQLLLQKGLGLLQNGSSLLKLAQSKSQSLLPSAPISLSESRRSSGGGALDLDGFIKASTEASSRASAILGIGDSTKSNSSAVRRDANSTPEAAAKTSPAQSPSTASKKRKSADAGDSNSTLDDQLIRFILRLHNDAGTVPNSDGFLPIHLACLHFPSNARLIGIMLCTNPDVARRRVAAKEAAARRRRSSMSSVHSNLGEDEGGPSKRSRFLNGAGVCTGTSAGPEGEHPYDGCYPLHVALANGAPLAVVRLLVRQAPDVLTRRNASGAVPLVSAIKSGTCSDEVLLFLLGAGPAAVKLSDNRMNSPLHHACMSRGGGKSVGGGEKNSSGSTSSVSSQQCVSGPPSMAVLRSLVQSYPEGLLARNFNGCSPLDLAQCSGTRFGDEEISYLHEAAYGENTDEVEEAPDV